MFGRRNGWGWQQGSDVGKMRSAEKVCVGEEKKINVGAGGWFPKKKTREKNSKSVGEAPPARFFLSGEKELGFRGFFVFFC